MQHRHKWKFYMWRATCAGASISIDRSNVRRWYSSKRSARRQRGVGDGYISTQFVNQQSTKKYKIPPCGCISWGDVIKVNELRAKNVQLDLIRMLNGERGNLTMSTWARLIFLGIYFWHQRILEEYSLTHCIEYIMMWKNILSSTWMNDNHDERYKCMKIKIEEQNKMDEHNLFVNKSYVLM